MVFEKLVEKIVRCTVILVCLMRLVTLSDVFDLWDFWESLWTIIKCGKEALVSSLAPFWF